MSYSSEDWKKAITTLIKKTSKKEVSWEQSELFKGDAWTEVDRSFQCEAKNKIYVVSETRSRHYLDEDVYVWQGGYDFSVYSADAYPIRLASAPNALHAIGSLFSIAEANYAYESDALGDLLD
jgi:hypothetical protein